MAVVQIHLNNREVYTFRNDSNRDEALALCREVLVERGTFVVHNTLVRAAQSRKDFATRVIEARRARQWSQADFAQRMNRSVSWVSQIERGTRLVDRMSVMQQMANVLEVNLSDLAEGGTGDGSDETTVVIPAASVHLIRVS